jgi:hypothetical protein
MAGLAKDLEANGAVAHQAARHDVPSTRIDRRNFVLRGQRQNLVGIGECKRTNNKPPGLPLDERREGRFVVVVTANFWDDNLPPEQTRRRKYIVTLLLIVRKTGVGKKAKYRRAGNRVAQKFEPLAPEPDVEINHPGHVAPRPIQAGNKAVTYRLARLYEDDRYRRRGRLRRMRRVG